jgi:hypothetical protein
MALDVTNRIVYSAMMARRRRVQSGNSRVAGCDYCGGRYHGAATDAGGTGWISLDFAREKKRQDLQQGAMPILSRSIVAYS